MEKEVKFKYFVVIMSEDCGMEEKVTHESVERR